MYMDINKTYAFNFKSGFETLNGIYTVTQKLTYDEIILAGIDLIEELYAKVNKDATDWDADLPTYRYNDFYKLEIPTENVQTEHIYIPEGIIAGYPDPNIHEYAKLTLVADLGQHTDITEIEAIKTEVKELLETNYGIVYEPKIVTYEKEWMTESDYDDIVTARENAKGTIVNYRSLSLELTEQLAEANAKIVALEQIITNP